MTATPGSNIYSWSVVADRLALLRTSTNHQIAFYRHGLTTYNMRGLLSGQHNTRLSERGRAQARQLSRRLPRRVGLVACSALARAVETMQLSMGGEALRETPIIIDPRINEVNLGHLEGKSRSRLRFGDADIDSCPEGGESYRTAARRVFSFLTDLLDELAVTGGGYKSVVVFSHAGILRIVSSLIRPVAAPSEIFGWKFENTASVQFPSRSIQLPEFWLEAPNPPTGP